MFWSGNYIAVRELNSLLKEEDVSLSQVLEADDILQECKADNKTLIQFLTRPEILAELITLITEEPPKNVELASQYRHASIACEVLTSQLSGLSDRLSLDTAQMNRLCDFINKEPPLNPLLASYFSKTVEVLLERSPKQDWYLYHIVCLRVLDFFRSRRDFLPGLLRHLHTSAVADTFKCFIRLDDLFNKIVMEWLDEHQFLECLIQIICGTYVPEPIRSASEVGTSPPTPTPGSTAEPSSTTAPNDSREQLNNEENEGKETLEVNQNHKDDGEVDEGSASVIKNTTEAPVAPSANGQGSGEHPSFAEEHSQPRNEEPSYKNGKTVSGVTVSGEGVSAERLERMKAVAAANAAALLCDLILNGCAPDGGLTRARTVWAVVWRLQSERWVRALLAAVFTSPPAARRAALVHACQILLALLSTDAIFAGGVGATERSSVELAVAPHLPLLHQALLQPPDAVVDAPAPPPAPLSAASHNHKQSVGDAHSTRARGAGPGAGAGGRVGAARVHVAALLAHLALSEVEDVPATIITLGTPGVLLELFLSHPDNNFLHAQVYTLVKHALANRAYYHQYANHLILECDLLTRLMDVFEENENKSRGSPRAGYMGHVVLMLRKAAHALDENDGELLRALRLPEPLRARWAAFRHDKLRPLLQQHDTPLGGYYPSDNIYEADHMADLAEGMEGTYEFNTDAGGSTLAEIRDHMKNLAELSKHINKIDFAEVGEGGADRDPDAEGGDDKMNMLGAKNAFLELANQRFDDDLWEDAPALEDELSISGPSSHDVSDVLAAVSPWDIAEGSAGFTSGEGGEEWAQFGAAPPAPPVDPYAPVLRRGGGGNDYSAYWPAEGNSSADDDSTNPKLSEAEESIQNLQMFSNAFDPPADGGAEPGSSSTENNLAKHLLSAMSGMSPDLIANFINANFPDQPLPTDVQNTDEKSVDSSLSKDSNVTATSTGLNSLENTTIVKLSEDNKTSETSPGESIPKSIPKIDTHKTVDNIDISSKSLDPEPSTHIASNDAPSSDNSSSTAADEPSTADSTDTNVATESEQASDS